MQAAGTEQPDDSALEASLRRSLYRYDCPNAHSLGEYHLDVLAPEARVEVARHLTECDACRDEVDTLRDFLRQPIAAPESVLRRARRLVATLLAPAPGLAYGGLRGSAPAVRVFEVEDVTVTIGQGAGPGTLIGLVSVTSVPPETLVGRAVRLVPRQGDAHVAALDEIGNFEVSGLPAGPYALELELPDSLIVIEELHVA